MKFKIVFTLVLAVLSLQKINAQQELTFNFSNFLFYETNINYEYLLKENMGLMLSTGYVYGLPDVAEPNKFFYVGLEYRIYVAPKRGGDGFFIGAYSRYKNGFYPAGQTERGRPVGLPNQSLSLTQNATVNYDKLALGITFGSKWQSESGFVYGFFLGFGRNLVSAYSYENYQTNEQLFIPGTYQVTYGTSQWDSALWDLRFGFNLGWRF
jgi:hypothetical protein